jgi:phage shock protein PspC (stress-responsive transcriptional regulator)
MKKNISINISGIIFHIEEDGYDILKNYLDSITQYFASFEDSSEIMADIESRIAEIFLSKLHEGKQVIVREDIQHLIATMGSVSDFKEVEDTSANFYQETNSNSQAQHDTPNSSFNQDPQRLQRDQQRKILGGVCSGIGHYLRVDPLWIRLLFAALAFAYGISIVLYLVLWIIVPGSNTLEEIPLTKKMFRDTDKKVIAGVCNGIASYFGIDVVIIRILFLGLVFLGGSGVLAYIVFWIALPEARTLTDRMQMQGEPVTLSNIELNLKKNLNEHDAEESLFSKIILFPFRLIALLLTALGKLIRPLVDIMRVLIGLLVTCIGASVGIGLLITLGLYIGLFSTGVFSFDTDYGFPIEQFNQSFPGWLVFSAFIASIIPCIALILLGISIIVKRLIFSARVGWTLFVFFVASSIIISVYIPRIIVAFKEEGSYTINEEFSPKGKTLVLKINEIGMDDYHGTRLTLKGTDEKNVRYEVEYTSQGSTRQKAIENANMVDYHIQNIDSIFIFDSNITFKEKAVFRGQNVHTTLFIPYGQLFYMDESLNRIITQYINKHDIEDQCWMITKEDGLTCLTCTELDIEDDDAAKSYGFKNFNEIKINGVYNLELERGDQFLISLRGNPRAIKDYHIEQKGNLLNISHKEDNRSIWDKRNLFKGKDVKIIITMPSLSKIDASGVGEIIVSDFEAPSITVDLSGVIQAKGNFKVTDATFIISGTSSLSVKGSSETMNATVQGVSSLDAHKFQVERASVNTYGVSKAEVNVTEQLEISEGITNTIEYVGKPNLIRKN